MPPKDYSRQNPKCDQNRYSCNKNSKGRCTILHDTHFKRDCPFYKARDMVAAQLSEKGE